jgi:hypothetical protein
MVKWAIICGVAAPIFYLVSMVMLPFADVSGTSHDPSVQIQIWGTIALFVLAVVLFVIAACLCAAITVRLLLYRRNSN